ncbi:MAG: DNA-3-methyladenine glycosylase I [Mycoplasmatales bacterium]
MNNNCKWAFSSPEMEIYHATKWGKPVYDDQELFAKLCLDGAQAGLSWETILRKTSGYYKAFHNFDISSCAQMTDAELELLRECPEIVRNRLKIYSVRTNAQVILEIQREFGSFSNYLWAYVGNKPLINHPQTMSDIPTQTELSQAISRDLSVRGAKFVGPVIIYAYLQACGLINDHLVTCEYK